MKKKILLFGGSGLLGSRITSLMSGYTIIAPKHTQTDLTDRSKVEKIIAKSKYNVIIYAAGISNQDFAEENHKITMAINKSSVEWIAKIAAAEKIPVVYFSTDAVFSGRQSTRPYSETDSPSPVNYYGRTKLAGEEAVLTASKDNLILRLISLYSGFPHKKIDFARLTVRTLTEGKNCYGITDQYFNPCFADTIVDCLQKLIDKKISNIIHLGATDYITNYEFTRLIASEFSLNDMLITPITCKDFFKKRKAKRGKYTCLDTTLAQTILGKGLLKNNKQNINIFHKQFLDYRSEEHTSELQSPDHLVCRLLLEKKK